MSDSPFAVMGYNTQKSSKCETELAKISSAASFCCQGWHWQLIGLEVNYFFKNSQNSLGGLFLRCHPHLKMYLFLFRHIILSVNEIDLMI